MDNPLVSVIIPTTDSELKFAESCRQLAKLSTYKNIEILIINEDKERSAQRNIGIDKAKGKYLLFLDSDQGIPIDLIEDCVNRIKYFGGVYIPEFITDKTWFGHFRNWER